MNGSSLRAAVHRVTTDTAAAEGPGAQPLRLATLSGAQADGVFLGLAAACLLALAVHFARGAARSRAPRRAALDLALVTIAAALLSPLTRKAHLVGAILPAAVLGAGAFGGPVVGGGSRGARACAALAIALAWAADASLVGRSLGRLAWGLNVLCAATVLVAVGLWGLSRDPSAREARSPPTPPAPPVAPGAAPPPGFGGPT